MGIPDYSKIAADNNDAAPNGWPEGMAASDVNNSARQNMADTRTQWNDAEWFEFRDGTPDGVVTFVANNQFKIVSPTSTDVTSHWHVGRRVQIFNAGTFFATITATSFSVDTTTVTIDITSLTNTTLTAFASTIPAVNSNVPESLTIDGGTIDDTPIGATTPDTGSFTSINASGLADISRANNNDQLKLERTGSSTGAMVMGAVSDQFRMKDANNGNAEVIRMDLATMKIPGIGDFSLGGVFLGGTAAANLLNDYEEGTFTPLITDGTNDATPHPTNAGFYTKAGQMVTCYIELRTTNLGSVTGAVLMSGLPFAIPALSNGGAGGGGTAAQLLGVVAGQSLCWATEPSTSTLNLRLYDSTGGSTQLQETEWSSDGLASFTATYRIA